MIVIVQTSTTGFRRFFPLLRVQVYVINSYQTLILTEL